MTITTTIYGANTSCRRCELIILPRTFSHFWLDARWYWTMSLWPCEFIVTKKCEIFSLVCVANKILWNLQQIENSGIIPNFVFPYICSSLFCYINNVSESEIRNQRAYEDYILRINASLDQLIFNCRAKQSCFSYFGFGSCWIRWIRLIHLIAHRYWNWLFMDR